MIRSSTTKPQPAVLKSGSSIFLRMTLTRRNGLYFTPWVYLRGGSAHMERLILSSSFRPVE